MIKGKISVIMPVYNSADFLNDAINSILNQTYKNFELLLINDCSTDKSLDIIEDFAKKDNRVLVLNQIANSGPASTRNLGLNNANGEFIAFMDSDDIAISNRFEKQISVFKNNSNIGICGSWYTEFGENKKKHLVKTKSEPTDVKIAFLTFDCIGNSTIMFRKNILGDLKFDLNYIVCEDFKFKSELLLKSSCYIIPESLLNYRVHPNSISKIKAERIETYDKQIKLNFYSKTLKINNVDENMILNLFNYRKKMSESEIIELIALGNTLIKQNSINKEFEEFAFQKRIYYLLNKVIKHGNIKYAFIRSLKKSHSNIYSNIYLTTKFKIFFK